MLLRTENNWKKKLSPEDESRLNEMLERTGVHRPAYSVAEDIKIAQLWCALIEMRKENTHLKERLSRLEYLMDGFVSRATSLELNKQDVLESHKRF
ncbi:MAG: hypothetical protein HZB65_03870 [Candidatus Aenigmarchaeota archaeon]|nr:hypothetical protein [Candidatus Aenigmarchaeota archaeon]